VNYIDLISVIIPTYNRAHLIKRSIDSVLSQTYKNLELIIVDDGSTDNTKEVIDSINDERLVYIKQKNQGASAARNKGIDIAKGKYIAFNDSDDVWHLDKLEKEITKLKENNADVVFCKQFTFGNLRKIIIPKHFKEGFLEKRMLPIGFLLQGVLGKAEIFKHNLFNTELPISQDFEIMLRIHQNYSIYCIDEPLFDYYIQKDSISIDNEKMAKDLEYILIRNKNLIKKHSLYLEILATQFLAHVSKIADKQRKKELVNLIFSITNSNKTKIIYLCHKFHLYDIRKLIYNSISIPLRKIINLFK
jgi:glycosyltransferase involved in cell wall biosynthesis